MDHKAIQDQLFALYDGELRGVAQRAVEDHLLDCVECRALLARWNRVAGTFFQSPAVSTSEAFVERVMRRIVAQQPQPVRLSRWLLKGGWLIPAMGLAAMLVVMTRGPLQKTVSIESLLLVDGREPAAMQRVLTGESPSADDILGLLMEEAS